MTLALDIAFRHVATDNDEDITRRLAEPTKFGDRYFKYDVYTVDALRRTVHGLTDGVAPCDGGSEAKQAERQQRFPSSVLKEMLRTRVQDGLTTIPNDRDRILNTLVGAADADAEPPANHDTYWYLNRLLYKRLLPMCFDASIGVGDEEKRRFFRALGASGIDEFAYSFVHDGVPHDKTTRVLTDFLQGLPDTIAHLKLVLPLPTLPDQLNSYKHLLRVRVLNLSSSPFLEALPEWLAELPQLKHLHLAHCARLRRLPRRLPEIYSKFKDIIINLEDCPGLFAISKHGARHGASDSGAKRKSTPFLEIDELNIVRRLLQAAEQNACTDLLTILDGHGQTIESSVSCGMVE